jgi:NADP-dependent 3-hydroxy acid dehydrogenase YdfG
MCHFRSLLTLPDAVFKTGFERDVSRVFVPPEDFMPRFRRVDFSHFGYKCPQLGYNQPRPHSDLCLSFNFKLKTMAHQNKSLSLGVASTPVRSSKVWFITGASRGFGRVWAEAALKRGDKVAATARSLTSIVGLKEKYGENVLTIELDVTRPDQVKTAVEEAHAHFGRLDIVLNNAGYSLVGTIEEASAEDVKAMYDTNVFGALSVIQVALPLLRKQGAGHILGTSSNLGHVTLPVIGYYCSSKWAFEAIHESLAAEVKQFGIKVTIIEPGAYATEFGSQESLKFAAGLDVYADFKAQFFDGLRTMERGDPHATPEALFKVVDAENPPLRFFLGSHNLAWVRTAYAERLATWEEWQSVASFAQGQSK